jgi:hypothetical protein
MRSFAGNLKVKEVKIAEDERFVICFNPEGAARDAAVRARMIARLEEIISESDQLSRDKRPELRGVISTKPGLSRYLRVTAGGLLRTDAAKAKAEENLDGKYLLRTADPKLSAEDIALGYKQLPEVERGWRDMKQVIDLRPVDHRREDRIRAHVILCWLALLLARIAENAAGQTWPDPAPRAQPHPHRDLHRPRRHLPAAHRAGETAAGHPPGPGNRGPAPHLPAETPRRGMSRRHPAA